MSEITVHLSNLGKYAAGELTDTVLVFPTTTEQVQAALQEIGVDGLRYEEIIITDISTDIPNLAFYLGEHDSLDELNYLACRLQSLVPDEREKFTAAVHHGEYCGSLQDLINLTYNLSCYDLFPKIKDVEDYGRFLVDTRREFTLPHKARFYFDFAQYGDDTVINEGGDMTPQGYIFNNRTPFQEIYNGYVPREYRVFQYPMEARAKNKRVKKEKTDLIR